MQDAITRDPELMHGTPIFRGTRVPVQTLVDYLENGDSLNEFLEGFPTISLELAVQVLGEYKELRSLPRSCSSDRMIARCLFRPATAGELTHRPSSQFPPM